jgi:hypothetical protein
MGSERGAALDEGDVNAHSTSSGSYRSGTQQQAGGAAVTAGALSARSSKQQQRAQGNESSSTMPGVDVDVQGTKKAANGDIELQHLMRKTRNGSSFMDEPRSAHDATSSSRTAATGGIDAPLSNTSEGSGAMNTWVIQVSAATGADAVSLGASPKKASDVSREFEGGSGTPPLQKGRIRKKQGWQPGWLCCAASSAVKA